MRERQFFAFGGGAMLSTDSRFLQENGIHCYMTGWRYLIRTRPWIRYDTKGRPWAEIKEILEADGFTEILTPRFIYQNDGTITLHRERGEEICALLKAYRDRLAKTAPAELLTEPEGIEAYGLPLGEILDEHIEALDGGGDLHGGDI